MKYLAGIEGFAWNGWENNTFICAVQRIINYLEEFLTYPYLMGISGASFRFHIHKRRWSPLAKDATVGFSCGETAIQRLGFRYHFLQYISKTKEFTHHQAEKEIMTKQIKDSLDRGFPVLAFQLIKSETWGLITGYKNSEFVCLTYDNKNKDEPELVAQFPKVICILDNRPGYLNRIRSEIASFETAEELYTGKDFGNFYNGLRGYNQWIKNLRDDKFLTNLSNNIYRENVSGNYWMYITLIDSKISAVKYLRMIKDDFEDKSDLICKLADIYVEEEKILKEGLECVPKPSRVKYRKDWTMKMRRKQAEIIEEHLQLEKKSLEVLKRLNYGVFR